MALKQAILKNFIASWEAEKQVLSQLRSNARKNKWEAVPVDPADIVNRVVRVI